VVQSLVVVKIPRGLEAKELRYESVGHPCTTTTNSQHSSSTMSYLLSLQCRL